MLVKKYHGKNDISYPLTKESHFLHYSFLVHMIVVLITLTGQGRVVPHPALEQVQLLTTLLGQQRDSTCLLKPPFQEKQGTRHSC